jgi:pimeloyl-ACP methyl ester carboxylesterase
MSNTPFSKGKAYFLAAIVACALTLPAAAQGAGRYVEVEYPPSAAPGELQVGVTYILWIPEGVTRLRGVIVHQHGAGRNAAEHGATAAYDLHWQALAKKWDCALLGPTYHVTNDAIDTTPGGSQLWFDPGMGSDKAFLRALGELGSKSGHAELSAVPWILWGHSGGGIWSDVMTDLHPERVVAVFLRSGTAGMFRKRVFPQPQVPDAAYAIPILANAGVKETKTDGSIGPWEGSKTIFQEYRPKGGLIGFAPDPRTGHETGDSRYLAIPFFDAVMAMRLPAKGSKDQKLRPVDTSKAWLAPLMGDTAQPAAAYQGNPNEAVWLPNEAVAKAWMEYVKTGTVADTTPPPAPSHVRVSAKSGEGAEITWEAEADFESGIGGFAILRDGQELAKLPEKPPAHSYGRALFQGMSYHDTPEPPVAEMRYMDPTAKAGEKHTYAVVTINSTGLRSKPATQ